MAKNPSKGRSGAPENHPRETVPLTPLLSRAELKERLFQQLFDVVSFGPTEGGLRRKVGFVKIPEEELEKKKTEKGERFNPYEEPRHRLVVEPLGAEWPIHIPGARRGGRGSRPSPTTRDLRGLLNEVAYAFMRYMWPELEKKRMEDGAALLAAHGVGLQQRRGKRGESVASAKRRIETRFPVWDRYKALLSSLSSALGEHVKGGGHAPDEATEANIIAGLLIRVGVWHGTTGRVRGKVRQALRKAKKNPTATRKSEIGPVKEFDPAGEMPGPSETRP